MGKKLIKSINDSTREYAVSGYYNTLFKNYIETAGKTDGLSKYNISTLREVKEYIENCHVLIIKLLILAKILIKMYPNDSFLRGKCVHDLYMLTHSLGSQCKLYDVLGTKLKMCKVSDIELQKAINYNLKKVNERLSNVEKTSFDGYVELTSLLYYDNYLNKLGYL